MKEETKKALFRMLMCPGTPEEGTCMGCPVQGGPNCEKLLRSLCCRLLEDPGEAPEEKPEEKASEAELRRRITEILIQLGVPAHVKGYRYAREAIVAAVETPSVLDGVTKVLYPKVAKVFQTTPSRVERTIRHAIEVAWDRGDLDTLQRFFGYTVSGTKGKPTNSEFIAMIVDQINLEDY